MEFLLLTIPIQGIYHLCVRIKVINIIIKIIISLHLLLVMRLPFHQWIFQFPLTLLLWQNSEMARIHRHFDALAHQNIPFMNVQKSHLWSSALSGEVTSVIFGFEINSVNFPLAYQALHFHCQNPRRLTDLYVNQNFGQHLHFVATIQTIGGNAPKRYNCHQSITHTRFDWLCSIVPGCMQPRWIISQIVRGQLSSEDFFALVILFEVTNK